MTRSMLVSLLAMSVTAMACSGDLPTSSSPATGSALTEPVRAAMTEAIADEFRAETIYQGVVDDFGSSAPFVNVLTAEQRHSSSIATLFATRGLAVPANNWTAATVPHFATIPEACAAGAVAERENIAIYDRVFALDLPADVRQVFENNRAASLFNHLPAFERCAP